MEKSSPNIDYLKVFVYVELLSILYLRLHLIFFLILYFVGLNILASHQSPLFPNVQFWEDVFFDAVAQERDIIGMDQEPSEMMER